MIEIKNLSIADLKAIIDYCEKQINFNAKQKTRPGKTLEEREAHQQRINELIKIGAPAESELEKRLGIKE